MFLYHAVSSYQLIETTLHKNKYHRDEKCILFISQDVVRRLPNYNDFCHFFSDIWVYDNGVGNYAILKGQDYAAYFQRIFHEKKVQLSDFDEIYLACAHHSFGIFVAGLQIPFVFMEDGVGALSRPEVLHEVEKRFKNKDNLALQYGLYDGSNPQIKYCIYNAANQKEKFSHVKQLLNFEVYSELSAMTQEDRTYLLKIFTDISNIPRKKKISADTYRAFCQFKNFFLGGADFTVSASCRLFFGRVCGYLQAAP